MLKISLGSLMVERHPYTVDTGVQFSNEVPVIEEKKYDCPDCNGKGETMIGRMYPQGHTECYEDCDLCDGIGFFPEDIYLLMKLEGSI